MQNFGLKFENPDKHVEKKCIQAIQLRFNQPKNRLFPNGDPFYAILWLYRTLLCLISVIYC